MRDDDWTKLTRRLGEMANAPLYIDDCPNMTMMEIRAKAAASSSATSCGWSSSTTCS